MLAGPPLEQHLWPWQLPGQPPRLAAPEGVLQPREGHRDCRLHLPAAMQNALLSLGTCEYVVLLCSIELRISKHWRWRKAPDAWPSACTLLLNSQKGKAQTSRRRACAPKTVPELFSLLDPSKELSPYM